MAEEEQGAGENCAAQTSATAAAASDAIEEPFVDIHKPKPWHNWREFLKELGTIALGVGVAMAAEQGVEWFHWRQQVNDAKEVIASEMSRNISFAIYRTRLVRCVEQRLIDLDGILDDAVKQGSLPPLAALGPALQNPWSTGAWDSVVASQTATHFSREQLATLSLVYRRVERIEGWNREESDAWTLIRSMEGPGRRLNPSYETELRKAIRLAANLNGAINISGVRMIQTLLGENLPYTPQERRQMADAMNRQPPAYTCGKILTQAPPGYVFMGAMTAGNLAEMDQVEKRLPAMVTPPKP